VPWVHVRLDDAPKYYSHAPFARRATSPGYGRAGGGAGSGSEPAFDGRVQPAGRWAPSVDTRGPLLDAIVPRRDKYGYEYGTAGAGRYGRRVSGGGITSSWR
jgi:hypothetical protein